MKVFLITGLHSFTLIRTFFIWGRINSAEVSRFAFFGKVVIQD